MAITTSADYKTAIKADTELTRVDGEFGFYPDGAIEGSEVPSGDEATVSQSDQVNDGVQDLSDKWAEFGGMILDGTYTFPDPDDADAQIGYWSEEVSGADCTFSAPKPYRDYVMDAEYNIIGVTIAFDTVRGEYATAITIEYYDDTDTLIDTDDFTNDAPVAPFEFPCNGVKRIRVIINAWSWPGEHAKIAEILPGETFVFDPDNIYSFELTERVQPFETSLELPSFILEFDNSEKKFDVVNPSGLMSYLRKTMKLMTTIGLLTGTLYEKINSGEFYLYDWPDEPNDDSAQFICRPLMAFFANTYYTAPGTDTQTVAQAAAVIFGAAGITNYTVDATLASITVNQYIGDNVPLPNAMGQLAIAAGGYWVFGRDGSYTLRPWATPTASNDIDYDNAWEKPNIKQTKKITSVNVKYYTNSGGALVPHDNVVMAAVDDGAAESDICSAFIPTSTRADAVGALALDYFAYRLHYTQSYRGDMSIQAGDAVTVENDYTDQDVFVTKHKITWDGENKLDGSYDGVAAPVA